MLTMGVAIAVPEPFGEELRSCRARVGDPLASTVPSHITLAPPVEVEPDQVGDVLERLSRVAGTYEEFELTLQGTDTFRPVSPVVFVAVQQGRHQVEQLAKGIQMELELPASAFPFHPHVTVAHNVDTTALDRARDELDAYQCSFRVGSFALYLHDEDDGWMPKRVFNLR